MATSAGLHQPIVAGESERREIQSIERSLERPGQPARLVGPGDRTMILPGALYEVLLEAARQLAQGNAVSIIPVARELTTQEAAAILNVSRPHVVSLLETGKIPFHKVGTHRRIQLRDLLAFKQVRDRERRAALQAMVDEAQDEGIYED
jgi:excisionase family DNA binding protein